MKDLVSIALFVKVVQHKSFSEASRRLGISVSTVSRKISQLEQSLGVRLLERSTRKLRLTQIGREYFELCRQGIEEFEAADLLINNRQVEIEGLLQVSVPPGLAKNLVIPLVTRFQARYPKVRIRIWATDNNQDLIEDGIDIALRVGELDSNGLVAKRLLEYRHILVASPDYLETMGAPQTPDHLHLHRLLCFTQRFGDTTWTFTQGADVKTMIVEEKLSLNDHIGVQMAAELGYGIAEVPAIICGDALQQGTLLEVLPDWQFSPFSASPCVTLSAVYPSKQNLSSLVRLFKEFCVDNINDIVEYTGL